MTRTLVKSAFNKIFEKAARQKRPSQLDEALLLNSEPFIQSNAPKSTADTVNRMGVVLGRKSRVPSAALTEGWA